MNKYIDHTLLKANATKFDIIKLCDEAIEYDFKSVCVNPANVKLAKSRLENSDVLVCSVIGFPLGANTTNIKVLEAKEAIENGASEIDMVINIGKLIEEDFDYVLNEIKAIREASKDIILKVIIETSYLTKELIVEVSKLCIEAKADFIKTSTGYSDTGAKIEDIELIKSIALDKALIKASGGIRSSEDFKAMINAGANRIGTSSGIALINNLEVKSNY